MDSTTRIEQALAELALQEVSNFFEIAEKYKVVCSAILRRIMAKPPPGRLP
jgi:hypothetical protein